MLRAERVTPETKELNQIKALYCRAFPANERRPFDDFVQSQTEQCEVLAFYDGELLCGFACMLHTDAITHIIYLATQEELRGRGYGSQIIAAIHARRPERRVIVDIERPCRSAANNDQRRSRKQFYLRNGYRETPVCYRWENESYEILSHGGGLTGAEFGEFWQELERRGQKEI